MHALSLSHNLHIFHISRVLMLQALTRLCPLSSLHTPQVKEVIPDAPAQTIQNWTSGPVLALAISRPFATSARAALMGPSDPSNATSDAPLSRRALYGANVHTNACFGSSNEADAKAHAQQLARAEPHQHVGERVDPPVQPPRLLPVTAAGVAPAGVNITVPVRHQRDMILGRQTNGLA